MKINVSTDTVNRIAKLRNHEYKRYSCRCVETCGNIECTSCIFNNDDKVYRLEELKDRLIKGVD